MSCRLVHLPSSETAEAIGTCRIGRETASTPAFLVHCQRFRWDVACRRAALTIFLLDDDDVDGTAERGRIDGVPGIRNCVAKIANVIHGGKRPRVREGVRQADSENSVVSGGRGRVDRR